MKKGIDYQVTPIKPSSKYSNKEMDDLLFDINEVLYFFRNLYINEKARDYLLKKIESTGKKLQQVTITVGDAKLQRRQEILGDLRIIYNSIKKATFNQVVDDDLLPEVEKMNGYICAMVLKDKRENQLTVDKRLEWLKHINRFSRFYPVLENVKSINNEILESFKL